jgi:hypothetical protein
MGGGGEGAQKHVTGSTIGTDVFSSFHWTMPEHGGGGGATSWNSRLGRYNLDYLGKWSGNKGEEKSLQTMSLDI